MLEQSEMIEFIPTWNGKDHIKVQTTAFSTSLSTHQIVKNKNHPKMSLLTLYHISVSSANQILLIDTIHWYTVIKPAHIGFIKSFIQFKFFSCYENTILSSSLKEKYASSMVQYILQSKE